LNVPESQSINPLKKPRTNPTIVLREEFENRGFLYDPDTGNTYHLNPVGVFVWKRLDGRHTISQIVDKLSRKFEKVPVSVVEDLKVFLHDLREKGFIE